MDLNSEKEIKVPLIEEINDFHKDKPVTYKGKSISIISMLSDIYELFYKNCGSPITTVDLVKKSYDFDKAERFFDKVVTRHLYPEHDRDRRPSKLGPPNLINLIHSDDGNFIYPLAISLKTKNGNIYDFTAIDSFNTNFDKISEKIVVNICKSSITLKEFVSSYNEDPKNVTNSLMSIARNVNKAKTEYLYDTINKLKGDVSKRLKENKSFWNLDYSRNKYFVGRELILKVIDESLSSSEGNSVAIVGLSGLGGVGKSQLAIEYAYQHKEDNRITCWLRAESSDSLEKDYFELASFLKIPFNKDMKKEERIKRIRRKLEERKDWLLIFDNALTIKDIDDYLPKSKVGRVLVTSRNPIWRNMTKILEVDVFTPSESIDYILKLLLIDETNKEMANNLAVELGYLPLALSQACAYIKATGKEISNYLELFKDKRYQKGIFNRKESLLEDYQNTVETTWSISIEKIEKSCPDGVYLLNLCAFMAPEGIPIRLIKKGSNLLPWNGTEIFSDEFRMDDALSSLIEYSLVQYGNEMLSVHRLVQLITRNSIEEDKMSIWIGSLIKTISTILPVNINIRENRDIYYQLLPHLSNIIRLTEEDLIQYKDINKDIVSLVNKVGIFLFNTSDFKKDVKYQEKSLKICQEIGDKQGEANCYTKLGTDYNRLGDYQKDKEYQGKSLRICQEISYREGEANCYTNLGKAFHNLCYFKDAIEYQEKGLRICQEIGDKQGEANCYINLGVAYYRLGNFSKDIEYQDKGLKICQEIDDLSGEAKCYTNLSNAYLSLGNFKDAIEYQEKSLKICLDIGDRQGESTCYNNLGVAYHSLGEYERNIEHLENAVEYQERSLKICQKIGDREGETKCYGNLGNIYHSRGDYAKDIEHQEKSLKICLDIGDRQGESTCYNNLGNAYYNLNDYKKDIEYQEKSLKICLETGDRFGESKCYTSFRKAYDSLSDYEKAREYEEKSRKIGIEIGNQQGETKHYTILADVYNRLS
jgi:tetratricopeptide (TPR) repeat protein